MRRSIVFAIDVEPDGRSRVHRGDSDGTQIAFREITALRTRLEQASQAPVRFNWFLRFDPQIEQAWGAGNWIDEACPDLIPSWRRHGDLIGIHPHFWRWDPRRERWFNDFADAEWRAHCLRSSIRGFESALGSRPAASRFGDRWLSNDLVQLLRDEGIRYDLTVEPGVPDRPLSDDGYATARLPDFRRAPRIPYQPSEHDFLVPAPSPVDGFWIVPVTTTESRWTPQRRFPFLMNAPCAMNLVLHPQWMWGQLSAELQRTCRDPLVFLLRTGDLSHRPFRKAFQYIAERLASHPTMPQCRFTGVDEAVHNVA